MTATTVPPPGWNPIGAPELRANTRRFLTRALAISGAGHLAVLAVVLWLQARAVETRPTWYETPIDVIRIPPSAYRPIPPSAPPSARPGTNSPEKGEIYPVLDPPTIEKPGRNVSAVTPGIKTERARPAPPSTEGPSVEQDPVEGAFVAYDRAPIPYFRPAPAYPPWARDAGIEGRVVLHVLVGRDGRVARVTVIRDVEGLTDGARETIARWRFHPALSGRNPVAVWVEIPIEFRL
jgi:protein TonB